MKKDAVAEILEHILNKNFVEKNTYFINEDLKNKIMSLLTSLDNHTLPQKYQDIIVQNIPNFLPLLSGITFETIIAFCQKSNGEKEDISILFETYNKNIKNNEKDFIPSDEENKKKLIIALLSTLDYENLLEFGNPEALTIYNKIVQASKKLNLNEEELKEILSNNSKFIGKIENPSEDLQMIAKSRLRIVVLKYVSNPSDKVLAELLTQYACHNPYFKERFKNGVDDNIIEMAIKQQPSIAFCNDSNGVNIYFDKKLNDSQIDLVLSIDASGIEYLKPEQLTTDRVYNAVVTKPSLIEALGSKFNYYSSVLAKCARDICNKLPETERESQLKIIENYEKKVAEIDAAYKKMISLDEVYKKSLKIQ